MGAVMLIGLILTTITAIAGAITAVAKHKQCKRLKAELEQRDNQSAVPT